MPRAAGLTVARLALLTGHKKGAICAALRKLRAAGKVSRFTGGRKGGGYYVYWTWNQGAPDG
jgi:predicted transcriptional regulator